jgi:tRNA threonylcarbamoyladenosine modification (KEOPS) complex  Pcc1 subunit
MNERTANAILQSITPDNLEAPEKINIITKTDNNVLIIQILCSNSIASFIATIDDLLQCIQAAESALQSSFEASQDND